MPYPAGLRVHEHLPPGHRSPVVVLVHGTLDRAASFARTVRRLDDLAVVTYDRRGYGGSGPGGPPVMLADHVADLLGVAAEAGRLGGDGEASGLSGDGIAPDGIATDGGRVVAVGHSVGGNVVLGAAVAHPERFASVGAFEPPMPWLGFRNPERAQEADGDPGAGTRPGPAVDGDPGPAADVDPATEAERFFVRMVGQVSWDRLPERTREARRAEGRAVAADLAALRGPAPFDVTRLAVPALFGRGGPASQPHHRQTVDWLASHVPGAGLFDVDDAGHGVHLSHPDAFAQFVRAVAAIAAAVTG